MVDFGKMNRQFARHHNGGGCESDCYVCRTENKEKKAMEDLDALDKQFNTVEPKSVGGTFQVLPENTKVKAVIVSQKPVTVGQDDKQAVELEWEIMAPEKIKVGKEEMKCAGRRIFNHKLWVTSNNMPYLKGNLTTLGWHGLKSNPPAKISSLLNQDNRSLIGLGAELQLGVESFQAKDKDTKELMFEPNPQKPGELQPKLVWKNTVKFVTAPFVYVDPEGAPPETGPSQDDDSDIPF